MRSKTTMKAVRYIVLLAVTGMMTACSDNLAEIGDKEVTREQFATYLAYKGVPEDRADQADRLLEDYARREAMAQAISRTDRLNMDRLEIEVDEFRKQALISRYFDQYLKDKVDDAAVANYYAKHADDYQARKAHLAHVLFRLRPKMAEAEREAKLTAAREALGRIRKGEDFEAVAKAVSEDQVSASKGGDLGWVKDGAVSESFTQAAFSLKQGEVSDVVSTPFGFHVIKMLEEPRVVSKPLEAVTGDIRYLLRQQAKDVEVKRLMKSVEVEVSGWKQ